MNSYKRDDAEFYRYVGDYCSEFPDVIPGLIRVLNQSIINKISEEREIRSEIEIALVAATAKRCKRIDKLLLDKLEKVKSSSCINWESTIEELKKRLGNDK